MRVYIPEYPAQNLVAQEAPPARPLGRPCGQPLLSAGESRAAERGREGGRPPGRHLSLEGPYRSLMDLCWVGGFERHRVMTCPAPLELWNKPKRKESDRWKSEFQPLPLGFLTVTFYFSESQSSATLKLCSGQEFSDTGRNCRNTIGLGGWGGSLTCHFFFFFFLITAIKF